MPRKPKYGYARDYFGRVQERDSFKDGAYSVNDYGQSSYDPEDDNGDTPYRRETLCFTVDGTIETVELKPLEDFTAVHSQNPFDIDAPKSKYNTEKDVNRLLEKIRSQGGYITIAQYNEYKLEILNELRFLFMDSFVIYNKSPKNVKLCKLKDIKTLPPVSILNYKQDKKNKHR